MNFQEQGSLMKPTRIIKMRDGHSRPAREDNLGGRRRGTFSYILLLKQLHHTSQETKTVAWYCLINLQDPFWEEVEGVRHEWFWD
jgi:hypothetical protein